MFVLASNDNARSIGRCFIVHQPQAFVERVLPVLFGMKSFTSFQRQLSLYGFRRVNSGPDKGGYYHPLFLKGKHDLVHGIRRYGGKKTGPNRSMSDHPDFYAMAFMGGTERITNNSDDFTSERLLLPPVRPQCMGSSNDSAGGVNDRGASSD